MKIWSFISSLETFKNVDHFCHFPCFHSVNVDVEDDPRRRSIIGMRTAADASCTQCNRLLGLKWIVVPDEKNGHPGQKIHTGSEKACCIGTEAVFCMHITVLLLKINYSEERDRDRDGGWRSLIHVSINSSHSLFLLNSVTLYEARGVNKKTMFLEAVWNGIVRSMIFLGLGFSVEGTQ
ncbi:hypothetical protein Acr_28g0012920 [Actinidia rufa]|uniref:Uncharacterized protein n=1 Tax=Actinidia rufa TaxID=165716 RepID=A0A7J0HBU5_9ERIC|nr:hypothetical protein Acr_28g0012920 [Actinidia rufa]